MFIKMDITYLDTFLMRGFEILDFFYQLLIFIVDRYFKFLEIKIATGLIKLYDIEVSLRPDISVAVMVTLQIFFQDGYHYLFKAVYVLKFYWFYITLKTFQ